MSFEATVDKIVLKRVVRQAMRVVPAFSESTLRSQVLGLTASGGGLTVEAGNGTETVSQQVPLVDCGDGDGDVAVPIRLLSRIVTRLPDGLVHLSADTRVFTISAGSFETTFPHLTDDEADRPLPPADVRYRATLPASVLSAGFNHLALALAHSRAWGAALTGIELTTAPGLLRFAATDRTQLALVELPGPDNRVPGSAHGQSLLLSRSALNAIATLLPTDGQVQLSIGDDQADLSIGPLALRCRLQNDPYPDYAPIVNTMTTRRIELSRTKLGAAVERVAILAGSADAATVWIELGADEVRVRATDLEVGEAIETRPAAVTGGSCELGLYLWGLLAIVRRLRGNDLIIEFGQTAKAITISTSEHPAFRYHLLPVTTAPPPSRVLAICRAHPDSS
ncbi:hypothetical protein [Aquihabitans sp. McL0605]|uniref:DNA polymerase III subunit beta family protein n=1 Tax=Aquihabitans sp. McL0605 TaxID=3415671 RepID=UPI003CE70924